MANIKRWLLVALMLALAACSSDVNDIGDVPELETTGEANKVSLKVTHDAEENSSGRTYIHGSDLELGYDEGKKTVGLQFDNLNVPRGAKVTNAYIQFRADESDRGSVKLTVRAEDVDDTSKHKRRKHDISSRKVTSASVSWQPKSWTRGERGSKQRTPNLKKSVQEVVDRKGWKRGNDLGFVITGSGKGKRVAESLNGDRKNRPMLVVEYQEQGASAQPAPSRPESSRPEPSQPKRSKNGGVPIILDTDYGFDVDDVGALAVLHALADNGEADILATTSVVTDPHTPGAMDAVNTFYGRPNLPVGQNDYAPRSYKWDTAYPYWRNAPRFVKNLDKEFPNNLNANVPSAVATYRKVLAAQPDNSVTIVAVGFMKNLADLVKSGPDRYSKLSGKQLVQRKVKKLVIMGGRYPGNDSDFNLTNGPARTAADGQYVIKNWPTRLDFTGGELCGDVYTGRTLGSKNSRKNPVARAYQLFSKSSSRSSWDLCSVLYAVKGNKHEGKTYFSTDSSERIILKDNLSHHWKSGGRSGQARVERQTSIKELERVLEDLLTQSPK